MRARSKIHLVDGSNVRCQETLTEILPSLQTPNAGAFLIPVIKDHGEVREACIPTGAVVWVESLEASSRP